MRQKQGLNKILIALNTYMRKEESLKINVSKKTEKPQSKTQNNKQESTGIPHFIALSFIVLHRY